MAQITLKIQVNDNAGTSLNFSTTNAINNVSSLLTSKTTKNDGVNGISFAGDSISLSNGYLGDGGLFQSEINKYNGYMFGVTDDDGKYSLKLTLTGDGSSRIIVYFDKNANQFATEAIIDGTKTIYNDDSVWAIKFDNNLSTHTIEFTKWNRPNYNACFTLIQIMIESLELNKNWINNLESLSQSTTNSENIEYGILASSGSVDILDNDGFISDLITDGFINPSSIPVSIFINNKLAQNHITTSSSYDSNENVLSIRFSNEIENMSKQKYKGYNYPDEPKTAYEMLYDVLNSYYENELKVSDFDEMLSEKIVYGKYNHYGKISECLKSITIQYPFIQSNKTYAEIINEFCVLAQLQAFISNQGKLKFTSARPVVPLLKNGIDYILMPPHSIYGDFQQDIILKNMYDGVTFSYTNVDDTVDTNAAVYNWKTSDVYTSYEKSDSKDGDTLVIGVKAKTHSEVSALFYTATVTIPKKNATNLEQILELSDGTNSRNIPNIIYSVKYTERKGVAQKPPVMVEGLENNPIPKYTETSIKYGALAEYNSEESKYYDISSTTTKTFDNLTASVKDDTNLDNVKIVDDENNPNNYKLTFTILVGFSKFSYVYIDSLNTTENIPYSFARSVTPIEAELTIYGKKRTISFQDSNISKNNSISPSTPVSISGGGTFTQNTSMLDGEQIIETIPQTILSDYDKGIKTAKVTVNGMDFYDNNGEIVKNWANGDIIDNGDILGFSNKLNRDNSVILWKTTGRNFKYDGEPLTDLELMECKPVELYTDYGQFSDNKYQNLSKSLRVLSNEKIINISDDLKTFSSGENSDNLSGYLSVPKTVTNLSGDFSSLFGIKFNVPENLSISIYKPNQLFDLEVDDINKLVEKDGGLFSRYVSLLKDGEVIRDVVIDTATKIGEGALASTYFNSITIGDSVTSLGKDAFSHSYCENITLGNKISYIDKNCFFNSAITSITIPASVSYIGNLAFMNCTGLRTVTFASGSVLSEFGTDVFNNCTSLTEITIPASVKRINRMCFYNCTSLTKVTFENPNGWKRTDTGETVTLTNASSNATLLKNMVDYNIAIF